MVVCAGSDLMDRSHTLRVHCQVGRLSQLLLSVLALLMDTALLVCV